MNIKLIWDFKGSPDIQVATHYTKHIAEFLADKDIQFSEIGEMSLNEFHHIAYVVVKKDDVDLVKNFLKPNRAFILKT